VSIRLTKIVLVGSRNSLTTEWRVSHRQTLGCDASVDPQRMLDSLPKED